jgi:hypothetical protein
MIFRHSPPAAALEHDRIKLKHIQHWQIVGAFLGSEAIEQGADLPPCDRNGAWISFAQEGLEFGKDVLDGIEVGRGARQENSLAPARC